MTGARGAIMTAEATVMKGAVGTARAVARAVTSVARGHGLAGFRGVMTGNATAGDAEVPRMRKLHGARLGGQYDDIGSVHRPAGNEQQHKRPAASV